MHLHYADLQNQPAWTPATAQAVEYFASRIYRQQADYLFVFAKTGPWMHPTLIFGCPAPRYSLALHPDRRYPAHPINSHV